MAIAVSGRLVDNILSVKIFIIKAVLWFLDIRYEHSDRAVVIIWCRTRIIAWRKVCMRKAVFWKTDRFFGLLTSVVLLEVSGNGLINSLACKAYELISLTNPRMRWHRTCLTALGM